MGYGREYDEQGVNNDRAYSPSLDGETAPFLNLLTVLSDTPTRGQQDSNDRTHSDFVTFATALGFEVLNPTAVFSIIDPHSADAGSETPESPHHQRTENGPVDEELAPPPEQVREVRGPDGVLLSADYLDANGNRRRTVGYRPDGSRESETFFHPDGHRWDANYFDANNNLVRSEGYRPDGSRSYEIVYGRNGDERIVYRCDQNGQRESAVLYGPDNRITGRRFYGQDGTLQREVGLAGGRFSYQHLYNSDGVTVRETIRQNADGTATMQSFARDGSVWSTQVRRNEFNFDPGDRIPTFGYLIRSEMTHEGVTERVVSGERGREEERTIIRPDGQTTVTCRDANGTVVSTLVTERDGSSVLTEPFGIGTRVTTRSADGTRVIEEDVLGDGTPSRATTIGPDGLTRVIQRFDRGRLTFVETFDADGNSTRSHYNPNTRELISRQRFDFANRPLPRFEPPQPLRLQ